MGHKEKQKAMDTGKSEKVIDRDSREIRKVGVRVIKVFYVVV